jgi:hypothetical protein
MNDNELLEKAALICITNHAGQTDKAGQAYFQHPMRVALRCAETEQKIVALLHDTIEDTPVTPEYLLEQGFSQSIVDAVQSVTKRDGESYEKFVKRAAENPIGRVVKLHDLEDNLDVFRLAEVKTEDAQRLTKYLAAHRFLSEYKPTESDETVANPEPEQPRKSSTKSDSFRVRRADINKRIRASQRHSSGTNYNKERIMVTMPDRTVISHTSGIDTFAEVLRHIGFSRVEALGKLHYNKYPLVTREDIGGKYREETLGWYVLSNCPNTLKAIYINEIADALDEPIVAEIIPK